MTQSEAKELLAAEQTHDELHPGHGVLKMPTHEQIAKRAYDIYVKSGSLKGHCLQNWHQAEGDLRTAGHQLWSYMAANPLVFQSAEHSERASAWD